MNTAERRSAIALLKTETGTAIGRYAYAGLIKSPAEIAIYYAQQREKRQTEHAEKIKARNTSFRAKARDIIAKHAAFHLKDDVRDALAEDIVSLMVLAQSL